MDKVIRPTNCQNGLIKHESLFLAMMTFENPLTVIKAS